MICATCGRDNPGHLTFCHECGQRLAPRVAPPTPPVGLSPASNGPATSPMAATSAAPPPQRPAAPDWRFGPAAPASPGREVAAPPPAPVAAPAPARAPAPEVTNCPLCGSANQNGLRFCVTCGHLLAKSTPPGTPAPSTAAAAPVPPAPAAAATPDAPAPIAPARVVGLGTGAAPAMRLCPRCRGTSDQGAQFCRFCGASLADAASILVQPSPDPIGSRAAAPPAPAAVAAPAPPPALAAALAPAPATAMRPAAPSLAKTRSRLVLIARDGGEGPSYSLGDATDIGRTEGHIVIADDRYISPRHARIAQRGGAFFLRDLESTNGVFVRIPFLRAAEAEQRGVGGDPSPRAPQASATPDSEAELADQDLFLVGQQVLRFQVVKHAEEGFGVASENGTLVFGTPGAPRYARLSQRTVEGLARDVFHVRKAETVLGRESGDIVFTDDPFLSRRHAMLRVYGGEDGASRRFTLADLGSSNGTFLQVREEVRLRHGDHFRIGQQLFRFDT